MKIRFELIGPCIMLLIGLVSCQKDRVDVLKSFSITADESYLMSNLNVVNIITNGRTVRIVRRGHNIKKGNAFLGPWEELEAFCGNEKYIISDQDAGNNGLYVNSKLIQSGIGCKGVVIKFGEGVLNDQANEQNLGTTKKPIPLMK